jgi:hypothetical protein
MCQVIDPHNRYLPNDSKKETQMHKTAKHLIALLMIVAIIWIPTGAMATTDSDISRADPNYRFRDPQIEAGSMVADALVVRPLGIAATVVGFTLFVISVPFSALGRNVGEAWQGMVVYPAKFTFARPLGDFDDRRDPR